MSEIELQSVRSIDEKPPVYDNEAYINNDSNNASLRYRPDNSFDSRDTQPSDGVFHISDGKGPGDSTTDPTTFDEEATGFMRFVDVIQVRVTKTYTDHKAVFWTAFYIILALLYAAYFAYAMYWCRTNQWDEDAIRLCWLTVLVVLGIILYYIWKATGDSVSEYMSSRTTVISDNSVMISWIVCGIVYAFFIIFVIVDVVISKTYYNLISAAGIVIYVLGFFIFSKHPSKVRWRPVAWGLGIQFILALLILRWEYGFQAFNWVGDRVSEFLEHTDAGSEFVFGELYTNHFFAFKVLPVVIFFSAFISVLYYLGVMQAVIKVIASGMQILMGTTAAESLNAAGNIFIGQSEAPLLIRPLINDMTKSELHAVMTGGFATIAGTVLAAYISYGVPANHLITASVMSAPAALAMAKLFWPETEESKTTTKDVAKMENSPERNIIEAASSGASASTFLVANIAANLIAFIALLHFINHTLCWFAARIGFDLGPDCRVLETIFSYLFYPFSFIMGVDIDDCRKVASLVGIKTMINEFVAYDELGKIITTTAITNDWLVVFGGNASIGFDSVDLLGGPLVANCSLLSEKMLTWCNDYSDCISDCVASGVMNVNTTEAITLPASAISDRSMVIATYALCGFANIGSIGIMLGALGALAPNRKPDIAATVVRAMIAGNVACFMTACIAGLLYQGEY